MPPFPGSKIDPGDNWLRAYPKQPQMRKAVAMNIKVLKVAWEGKKVPGHEKQFRRWSMYHLRENLS